MSGVQENPSGISSAALVQMITAVSDKAKICWVADPRFMLIPSTELKQMDDSNYMTSGCSKLLC